MVLVFLAAPGADDHRSLLPDPRRGIGARVGRYQSGASIVVGCAHGQARERPCRNRAAPGPGAWKDGRRSSTLPSARTFTAMPSCTKCSVKLLPDQQVCSACGEPVPESGAEQVDTLIGQVIAGKFEVGDPLGEGAMGRVYRAKQLSLDKQVAIKVLHKHLAMDPKVSKRFHREARAASRLSHPNSLQMIDFGAADDGTLYIAMELLEGHDLLTVIE